MPFFDLHSLQQVFFIVPLQHNVDYVTNALQNNDNIKESKK